MEHYLNAKPSGLDGLISIMVDQRPLNGYRDIAGASPFHG